MSVPAQIMNAMAQAQDAMRDVFVDPAARFFLLKTVGHTATLTSVAEITSGHFMLWDPHREQMLFRIASTSAALENQIAQATHIGFGVGAEIDVYTLSPERRDRVPPTGHNPFWKLYGVRDAQRRYTVV